MISRSNERSVFVAPRRTIAALLVVLAALLFGASIADAYTPTPRQYAWKRLSPGGDYFLNYDGGQTVDREERDWPVGMIFYGDASVDRVKTFYGTRGFTREGGYMYMGYRDGDLRGPALRAWQRFDRDKGKKTECVNGYDDHFRVYGPSNTDRFNDPRYGYFVVATAHIDHGDGGGACAGTPWFGESEQVERRLAAIAASTYRVNLNAKPLNNFERRRVEGDHHWSNGGRATTVRMP